MTLAIDQKLPPSAGFSRFGAMRPAFRRAASAVSIFCGFALWAWAVRSPFWSIEGSDDAFFLEVAHLWTRGVLPYLGAFDIKPPGYFAILAVAETLFGASLQTLKGVSAFFDALAATALYFIGCRMGSRAIGIAAALLCPFLSQIVTNNPPYAPLAAFTTLAFLAAMSRLPVVKRAVLAGLFIGAAVTVKQTACFEAVALFAILLWAPDAANRRVAMGLAFGAAAAIAPAGFLIYFAAHGALAPMIGDVVANALLRPASAIEGISFQDGVLRSLVYLARPIEPLFALACIAFVRRRTIAAAVPDAPMGAISLWAASAIVSVWAQHSLFDAYLGPTLAPLTLLACAGAVFGAPELKRIAGPVSLALVGLLTVGVATATRTKGLDPPHQTQAIDLAAAAIKASHPGADDKLFVVSRGMWLYMATGLAPPTAYFHWEHTLCDFPGAGLSRLGEALATTPRFIAVYRGPHNKCELPQSWRQIDAALAGAYRLLARVQGDGELFDVYETIARPPE
jgi:Dolichyl-phosphate-mannose-protein mannosyltransferase